MGTLDDMRTIGERLRSWWTSTPSIDSDIWDRHLPTVFNKLINEIE